MAREAHPQRSAALKAIVEHETRLGPIEGARAAKKLFPDVGVPTWKTWVKLARAAAVAEPAEAPAVALHPITPMEAAGPDAWGVERSGWAFDRRIGEIDVINRALQDVAWPIDPETGRRGRVKNPMLLKVARDGLAQSAGLVIKHAEGAWNVKQYQEFEEKLFGVFVDSIKDEDPVLVQRVLKRMRAAIDARKVQTSHAAPGIIDLVEDEADA